MKTNRTKKILVSYLKEEVRHYEKMCRISNNDYDIRYYDGRCIVAQHILDELEKQKEFDIQKFILLIRQEQLEDLQDRKVFYKENKCDNERILGHIDEYVLLTKLFFQNYSI